HSIYRFRFLLLLRRRRRRDCPARAEPPCRAAGCFDAGCFDDAGCVAGAPPEFPSDGGRNRSRIAPSGLDRGPAGAAGFERGAGLVGSSGAGSAGSSSAGATSRFAGELLASIAPPFRTSSRGAILRM